MPVLLLLLLLLVLSRFSTLAGAANAVDAKMAAAMRVLKYMVMVDWIMKDMKSRFLYAKGLRSRFGYLKDRL